MHELDTTCEDSWYCKLLLLPKLNQNVQLATHILLILKYISKHKIQQYVNKYSIFCHWSTNLLFNLKIPCSFHNSICSVSYTGCVGMSHIQS